MLKFNVHIFKVLKKIVKQPGRTDFSRTMIFFLLKNIKKIISNTENIGCSKYLELLERSSRMQNLPASLARQDSKRLYETNLVCGCNGPKHFK